MMTMMKNKDVMASKVCVMCGGKWTMQSAVEKYCDNCKTHILIIEDEIYQQQGW
tara:strand:- start:1547 stop:1708 length:162 start_codon:yes stop_codon:yes gene_type:complete